MRKRREVVGLCLLLVMLIIPIDVSAENDMIHIVIDAGHGGEDTGASAVYDGREILEKDLNLQTAHYLGSFLEEYEGVRVSYTRTGDVSVDLLQRTMMAKERNADLLISIHHNAAGEIMGYDHGCTVLTGRGAYEKEICEEEQKLACNVLYELSEVGLENQGILLRQSENGSVYENGELADYYAIIRNGLEQKIPSILIEHAFVDSEMDYRKFLNSDEKIKRNAEADARALARCYQLEKKDGSGVLPQLANVKEKMTLVKDEQPEHNEISYQVFYEQKKDNSMTDTTTDRSAEMVKTEKSLFERLIDRMIAWMRG